MTGPPLACAAPPGREPGQRRVLIVDGEPYFRQLLARSFETLGFVVAVTRTGTVASGALTNSFLLAVVDQAPPLGGLELAQELRRRGVARHVVIVTSFASIEGAIAAVRAGLSHYFAHPVTAEQIVATLGLADPVASPTGKPADGPMTLARARWEYMNAVYAQAGSLAEAARRLGVDRRSLRRMLAKHPPAR